MIEIERIPKAPLKRASTQLPHVRGFDSACLEVEIEISQVLRSNNAAERGGQRLYSSSSDSDGNSESDGSASFSHSDFSMEAMSQPRKQRQRIEREKPSFGGRVPIVPLASEGNEEDKASGAEAGSDLEPEAVCQDELEARILIVDDTLSNILSIGTLLERCGLYYSVATSGKSAINIIKNRRRSRSPMFDLILMDF